MFLNLMIGGKLMQFPHTHTLNLLNYTFYNSYKYNFIFKVNFFNAFCVHYFSTNVTI